MTDVDKVREALEFYARTDEENYDYERDLALHDGTGNPGLIVKRAAEALTALDSLRAELEEWKQKWHHDTDALEDERDAIADQLAENTALVEAARDVCYARHKTTPEWEAAIQRLMALVPDLDEGRARQVLQDEKDQGE